MEELKIEVNVKGVVPLLMSKYTCQKSDTPTKSAKKYIPEEEAERVAYRTSNKKLYLPSSHFEASLFNAGKEFVVPGKGKKTYGQYVKAGLHIIPPEIILDQQEYIIHEEPVVIRGSRVLSWRPKFENWSCSFTIVIEDVDVLKPDVIKTLLEEAGKHKAVGAYRPKYGRFEITKFKPTK